MFFPFTKTKLPNESASREIERESLVRQFPPDLKKFPHDLIEQDHLAAGEFQYTAIALGERFYPERPRQFARRISRYFSDWETVKARCSATGLRPGVILQLSHPG
jgi:hypothetical protein